MTIGTAIILASLIIGTVWLFGITKDRWKWPKILRIGSYFLIGVLAFGAAGIGCYKLYKASNEAESARLAEQNQKQAEEKEKQDELKEKQAREKEKQARLCVANDIPRVELLLKTIQSTVKAGMGLEDAKVAVDKISDVDGHIIPPTDDIKQRVIIYSISTKCDSPFYFLVNVRAGQDGALRWLRVWAKNPPVGYPDGIHNELSTDFEEGRALKKTFVPLGAAVGAEDRRTGSSDPCAANLSRDARLQRLAAYGRVRQTSEGDFVAGGHSVKFLSDGSLYSCE